MAVAAADEHHLAERAGLEDLARLAEGAVVAVIEADAHQGARCARAASATASSSAAVRAPGFSTSTCLPAAAAAAAIGASWSWVAADEDHVHVVAPHRLAASPSSGFAR